MRRARKGDSSGIGVAFALSGLGAVAGWSVNAGSEIGVGVGLVAAAAALTTGRRWVTTAGGQDPPMGDAEDGWQEVQRELDRSRRHERPFVLIRIPGSHIGVRGNGHAPGAATATSLAYTLRPFFRSVDCLWASDGNLVVLLPESSRARAAALLSRVRAASPRLLPETIRLVAFPEDAVTRGALLALLDGHDIARYSVPSAPDQSRVRKSS